MSQGASNKLAQVTAQISSQTMGTLVTIHPSEPAHFAAIDKFGWLFWERETYSGMTRLIPVRDGIPYVAEFIFVPSSQVYRQPRNKAPSNGGG